MEVGVVGAGRVGTAVAVLLQSAGHRIVGVSGRGPTRERASTYLPGVPVVAAETVAEQAELVIIGVPDDRIAETVEAIASAGGFRTGQWVAHLSGASRLDVLNAARQAGAGRLAIHPLQTVPDVDGALERIPGSTIAVTADDEAGFLLGERLGRELMGEPCRLADELRPLYHAAAVFASNYLVVGSAIAEKLFLAAGLTDPVRAMLALQRATLDNIARLGPQDALTGPAVRGDAGTISMNLEALSQMLPAAVPAYVVMAAAALDVATEVGRLSFEGRAAVEEVLQRWR
jgi:predicted short-subunit dehydrogenase-like oxidoreductase (DUF2520 family)